MPCRTSLAGTQLWKKPKREPANPMRSVLSEYYRVPEEWETSAGAQTPVGNTGFFRFGSKIICYGSDESEVVSGSVRARSADALERNRHKGSEIYLPFNISQIIEFLRREHYVQQLAPEPRQIGNHPLTRKAYYFLRHFLPTSVRRYLQKSYFYGWRNLPFPSWPVDFTVDTLHQDQLRLFMKAKGVRRVPFIWFWPDGASNALVITHDVETAAGRDATAALMDLDLSYGFKATIQVIPEKRYEVPDSYVREIRSRGFEFNVHDLNHDGNLYRHREEFLRRAEKINEYIHKYEARGFRSGAMYRNVDWYDAFDFSYDMSVPNVAHLEPQRGGCCTVMPYFIGNILEIPLTMTQDYSLFHILNDYSIDLWKEQIDLVRRANGLISFIAHPDYLITSRERKVYERLLSYLSQMVRHGKIWAAVAGEIDLWWRARSQMKLIQCGNDWEIVGPEKERARVAYACLDGDNLEYESSGVLLQQGLQL
jgi:hypothetical protein